MKNLIRVGEKICVRRTIKLKSGEINCPRCGDWTHISRLIDKHFNEEYHCPKCKKELRESNPPPKKKVISNTKLKQPRAQFPPDCPHKPFFGCNKPSECIGCYYNPDKTIAIMVTDQDDRPKSAKVNWFYYDKKHSKICLNMLDDIKHGRGLLKGGNRCYFKYARKGEEE